MEELSRNSFLQLLPKLPVLPSPVETQGSAVLPAPHSPCARSPGAAALAAGLCRYRGFIPRWLAGLSAPARCPEFTQPSAPTSSAHHSRLSAELVPTYRLLAARHEGLIWAAHDSHPSPQSPGLGPGQGFVSSRCVCVCRGGASQQEAGSQLGWSREGPGVQAGAGLVRNETRPRETASHQGSVSSAITLSPRAGSGPLSPCPKDIRALLAADVHLRRM